MQSDRFSYQETKSGLVLISTQNSVVASLKGKEAQKFLMKIFTLDEAGQQLLMAKVTGAFKFGNERMQKEKNKR